MAIALFYNITLLLLGFNVVIVARHILHAFLVRRTFKHVPGPAPPSLLWGEEWDLYHSLPGSLYFNWHKRFGKVVAFTGAFGHQVLSITDPRAISFILGEATFQFPKPRGVRAWFQALLGEGILWVEGKKAHETHRRILAPAFNQQSVRHLTDIFLKTSNRLSERFSKIVDLSHRHELEIEITNWTGRFALDTIGLAAFSYDFDCLSGNPNPLSDALDGLTNNEHKKSSFYMRALFWLTPSILFIGRKGEMIRQVKRQLGEIASKMWKDAKLIGDTNNRTLMATMLKHDASSAFPMDEEQAVSQMRTIISAGYETVSAISAWMLYELASNPDFQSQLREEVCAIPEHSFEHFNNTNNDLPLLNAALKETLRLHPPILENHHEAAETLTIPLSSPLPSGDMHLIVPKGTLVAIPLNVLHTDPAFWGKDADEFRPQRWLDREGCSKQEGQILKGQELLAFSMGPRSCIGKNFAMTEIKCLMVTLLRQYTFRCPHRIEPFQSFVVRPRVVGDTFSSLPLLVKKNSLDCD